ncbi:MAG: hypothetical protein EA370_14870 [Wenzhouxiangella sp.]|nr:MAG: hypothetical protein EA370_14870 [Wenzhouxiangella sp.]
MGKRRLWQFILGLLLLIGLFDLLYVIIDIQGAMEMRERMLDLMAGGDGVDGTARVADLVPHKVLTMATLALGGLLVWRGLHLRSAQALLAFIIVFNLPGFTLVQLGLSVETLFQASIVMNVVWMMPLVAFAAMFPRRLTTEDLIVVRKPRGRIRTILGAPFRWLRANLLMPYVAVMAALVAIALSAVDDGMLPLLLILTMMWLAASYLRTGYLVADADGQRRVLWIVNGFSVAFWVMLVGALVLFMIAFSIGLSHGLAAELNDEPDAEFLIPYWWLLGAEWLYIFAMLAILASIAAATLYRGALDPGLVLRRTTVYGLLGVCMAFLFAILESILSSQVALRLGMPGSTGSWLAGGVTALMIAPLHSRIKRRTDQFIDRLLPAGQGDDMTSEGVLLQLALEGHERLSSSNPGVAGTADSLLQKVAQRAANRFRGRIVNLADGSAEIALRDREQAGLAGEFVADAFAAAAEVMELPPLKVKAELREQLG